MGKFILGFKYAWKGIVFAFSSQINFKFHTGAAILVLALGWYVDLNLNEWLWIMAAIGLVIAAELFNTALEQLVDLVSPDFNPKAGIVKDLASAAVLVIALLSLVIGLCVFLPKFF
ncbi:MAG: diacylglycerol kinase family protein [Pyrinomonadaceae bacterium]|nr:diacylglycerol kinase family protein [Sphingobacteriaceae bacterium]